MVQALLRVGLLLVALAATTESSAVRADAARADEALRADEERSATRRLKDGGLLSVTVGNFGEMRTLPLVNQPGVIIFPGGFADSGLHRPLLFGAGQKIEIGYLLGDRHSLRRWARGVRISAQFKRWNGRGDVSNIYRRPASSFFHAATVSGRSIISQTVGFALRSSKRSYRQNYFDVALKVSKKFELNRIMTFAPAVQLFGGASHEHRHFRTYDIAPPNLNAFNIVDRTSSLRLGTGLGLATSLRVTEKIAFNVSGMVGAYWIASRMRADDCSSFTGGTSCTTPPGTFAPGGNFNTSTSDRAWTVGVRARFSIGMVWRSPWSEVSVLGYFNWDSAVPGVEHPTGPLNAPAGTFVGASRIKFDPAWSAGAMIGVRVPLY